MAVRHVLFLAVLAAAARTPVFAQGSALPPFLELRVPKPPTVATGGGASFLAYEVHVTNLDGKLGRGGLSLIDQVTTVGRTGDGNPLTYAFGMIQGTRRGLATIDPGGASGEPWIRSPAAGSSPPGRRSRSVATGRAG